MYVNRLVAVLAGLIFYFSVQKPNIDPQTMEARARVIAVDDSEVRSSALSHIGFQTLEIVFLDTRFKGIKASAINSLNGQVDLENLFLVDDTIITAVIMDDKGDIHHVKAVDLYRQDTLLQLFVVFTAALLIYAGIVGIKALISFILAIFIIWEILVKQILNGQPPLITTRL